MRVCSRRGVLSGVRRCCGHDPIVEGKSCAKLGNKRNALSSAHVRPRVSRAALPSHRLGRLYPPSLGAAAVHSLVRLAAPRAVGRDLWGRTVNVYFRFTRHTKLVKKCQSS